MPMVNVSMVKEELSRALPALRAEDLRVREKKRGPQKWRLNWLSLVAGAKADNVFGGAC
jgi:hypothetical protein